LTAPQEHAVAAVMSIIRNGGDDVRPPIPKFLGSPWSDDHNTFGIDNNGDLIAVGGEVCEHGHPFRTIVSAADLPAFRRWLLGGDKKEEPIQVVTTESSPTPITTRQEFSWCLYQALEEIRIMTGIPYQGFALCPVNDPASGHTHANIKFAMRHGNTVSGLLDPAVSDIRDIIDAYLLMIDRRSSRKYTIGWSDKLFPFDDYYRCSSIRGVVTGTMFDEYSGWIPVRWYGSGIERPTVMTVVMARQSDQK